MTKIFYMIRKEFLQIFRTREMVAILFIMPVIQMVVLGFAVTNEVKHITLIIADRDNSRLSREIVAAFSNTDRFDITGRESDVREIGLDLHRWKAQAALIIPNHFGRDFRRGLRPDIQMIVDGLDGNAAGVSVGYAGGILREWAEAQARQTPRLAMVKQNTPQLELIERLWYNLDLRSAQYMVPGIIVVLLTIISMLLSALSLVKEREVGTLEQLMVTPLSRFELLMGKLAPFLILAFIEFFVVLGAAQVIFPITMKGSYALLSLEAFLYLFTTIGLGVMISTIAKSQQQALFLSWFFMLFLLMMSGLFIPIANMPQFLQDLTLLNPMRYFMAIIRDVFQKGSGWQYLFTDTWRMTLLGTLIFAVSVLRFRKRVS